MTYWTSERILESMRAWEREHGRPPTSVEWRKATPFTPAAMTVSGAFGSWNVAMACAGFVPRRTGPRRLVGANLSPVVHSRVVQTDSDHSDIDERMAA